MVLDSSVVLSYLNGTDAFSVAAAFVLDELVVPDALAVLSSVTVTEILVRPFRSGPPAVSVAEVFLNHTPHLRVRVVDYQVAREAARIRAATNLKTPDALIIATAIVDGSRTLVSTDDRWAGALTRLGTDTTLVHLGAHLPL